MKGSPNSRSTFGEALIALVALAGFIIPITQGDYPDWEDFGMYAAVLGLIVGFYAAILLIRAMFFFMTGSDSFWWEKYEHQKPAAKKKP